MMALCTIIMLVACAYLPVISWVAGVGDGQKGQKKQKGEKSKEVEGK